MTLEVSEAPAGAWPLLQGRAPGSPPTLRLHLGQLQGHWEAPPGASHSAGSTPNPTSGLGVLWVPWSQGPTRTATCKCGEAKVGDIGQQLHLSPALQPPLCT